MFALGYTYLAGVNVPATLTNKMDAAFKSLERTDCELQNYLCGSARIQNILRQLKFPSTERIARRERESRNFGL